MSTLTESEIDIFKNQIRGLVNTAKCDEAYSLSKKLMQKYPDVYVFQYYEAVLTAEDTTCFSQKEIDRRFKLAATKLGMLVRKIRAVPPSMRSGLRNEYFWFSKQPYKQYLLGLELVKKGNKRSYYSQGVGAAMLSKKYGLQGRKALCHRWAKISEKAWLNFFKHDSEWFNSYFFYAMSLGFQGKTGEMEKAIRKSAKIAKKPLSWEAFKELREEIDEVVQQTC